eukprot:TRINITY_DN956_c0_g3_i4.p3 TRINITY_DN956_c0_g3~~TRINITY_DN956_c0_g3_i4.p3  ORF type:complete len:186 (+),score=46.30 TRINITY_DN956_c0_g3_i4:722-1279(+)
MHEYERAVGRMYKLVLVQAISMCFYYSVEQTMICLEAKKLTKGMLKEIGNLGSDTSEDQLMRAIYGITAIILQPEAVPEDIKKELGQIFSLLVHLCGQILKEDLNKDDDSDLQDIEILDISDHALYASPLKKMHVLYYVKLKLEELSKQNPLYYTQLENSLSKKERDDMSVYMVSAEDVQSELFD